MTCNFARKAVKMTENTAKKSKKSGIYDVLTVESQ
jgi:hypothetical protein